MLTTIPPYCPVCKAKIEEIDKTTALGQDVRLYACQNNCGWSELVDFGTAYWKQLSILTQNSEDDPEKKEN